MASNMFGSNPANGSNYNTRNFVTRDPRRFASAVLPFGALAFLLCEGNMRGAIHDGKTCGGVAHFPLFHPSCDFTALYEAIDCPEDLNNNGTTDSVEPEPEMTLWTLLSKFPAPHPDNTDYTLVGTLGAGAVHPAGPEAGQSVNGWNVFTVCSVTQPVDDSNNHYWIAGSIDDYSVTDFTRSAPDSVC